MRLLRHAIAGMVLFTILVSLALGFYNELQAGYSFTPTDTRITETGETTTLIQELEAMNLLTGINNLQLSILKLNPPKGSNVEFDILGGLAIAGIGIIEVVVGFATMPIEFIGIVLAYYAEIPSIITELSLFVIVYVGFILVSLYHKGEA